MKNGEFKKRQPNEAQPLNSITDAELITSANTMLAASALSSDKVPKCFPNGLILELPISMSTEKGSNFLGYNPEMSLQTI
jgi:hypothetical protein